MSKHNNTADTLEQKRKEYREELKNADEVGNRTKGAEEQQVPHAPAPPAGFAPASSLQQFKSSLHKLDPWGEGTDQHTANYCHSAAEEKEDGDTGCARCSSGRIGHEGPDVPLPPSH
ncbi:hypothetical protein PAMP_003914 [Pampus punctatissimus]